jgi:hypothetical protein
VDYFRKENNGSIQERKRYAQACKNYYGSTPFQYSDAKKLNLFTFALNLTLYLTLWGWFSPST